MQMTKFWKYIMYTLCNKQTNCVEPNGGQGLGSLGLLHFFIQPTLVTIFLPCNSPLMSKAVFFNLFDPARLQVKSIYRPPCAVKN